MLIQDEESIILRIRVSVEGTDVAEEIARLTQGI